VTIPTYVIFVNGSYGVGKSCVLDHVGDLLAEHDHPFSLMDIDWFHRSWPPAAGDPDNVLTEAANMAAVWSNYRHAGVRQPVVAGVLTSKQDQARYAGVFELPVRSVRLLAGAGVVEARLRHRYTKDQQHALSWHLQRHAELSERLAQADLDELAIDTDERRPRLVAETILDHFGLLPTSTPYTP
jgi:hypothetical protein